MGQKGSHLTGSSSFNSMDSHCAEDDADESSHESDRLREKKSSATTLIIRNDDVPRFKPFDRFSDIPSNRVVLTRKYKTFQHRSANLPMLETSCFLLHALDLDAGPVVDPSDRSAASSTASSLRSSNTLSGICVLYGVSVDAVKRSNGLHADHIFHLKHLIIPLGTGDGVNERVYAHFLQNAVTVASQGLPAPTPSTVVVPNRSAASATSSMSQLIDSIGLRSTLPEVSDTRSTDSPGKNSSSRNGVVVSMVPLFWDGYACCFDNELIVQYFLFPNASCLRMKYSSITMVQHVNVEMLSIATGRSFLSGIAIGLRFHKKLLFQQDRLDARSLKLSDVLLIHSSDFRLPVVVCCTDPGAVVDILRKTASHAEFGGLSTVDANADALSESPSSVPSMIPEYIHRDCAIKNGIVDRYSDLHDF